MQNPCAELPGIRPQLDSSLEWMELGLKFAMSPPDSNVEGRWIFAYTFEAMNNRTFQFKTRTHIFYTLGMDGVE